MTFDISKEHAVETFKSLIAISVAGFKLLALLNGGAAVALLAYLGNVAGKTTSVPDMRLPMGVYLLGLFLCGLAFFGSYLTQLRLYEESTGQGKKTGAYEFWWWVALVCACLSLVAFGVGSIFAVFSF